MGTAFGTIYYMLSQILQGYVLKVPDQNYEAEWFPAGESPRGTGSSGLG
jgi:hypothetical protein